MKKKPKRPDTDKLPDELGPEGHDGETPVVSAVKVDQLRTQSDFHRESIGHEIVQVADDLRQARDELERLRTIAKDAKSDADEQSEEVSSLNSQLTQLALDMARVEDGTYEPRATQQTLPFASKTTTRVTTLAESAPLAELLKHGCPKGLISSLASSQLAAERKLETVGDLLAAIQADDYWYKKIKGMGDERKDKLIDAITAWGQANPEPAVEDGRRKQCTHADCQKSYTHGLFVESFTKGEPTECPVCGNNQFWQLVDPAQFADDSEADDTDPHGSGDEEE